MPKLTNRFAGPLSFPISQTDALQHVVSSVMGSLPCVSNLVGVPSLMTAVYNRVQVGKQQHNSQKCYSQSAVKYSEGKFQSTHLQWCNWFSLCQSQCKCSPRSSHPWASHKSLQPDRSERLLYHSRSLQLGTNMDFLFFILFSTSNLTCHMLY